jgi:hypothetical protein
MATETVLAAGRRAALREQWIGGYDDKGGGWGFTQKFLDWDSVELALRDAARGDAAAARRARETLTLQLHLLDPAWGGIYQYSIGGGWTEPHFEKIMTMQSENLRIYARAYAQWGDPVYLKTARAIQHYLETFLTSPEGAFYTSQDADLVPGQSSAAYFAGDDRARRSFGVPRVDRHVYSRENGWAASALVELAGVTGDRGAGNDAETAVRWVIDHRALPGGGFSHDERDAAGPYLGDTLSMGRAFLALHELTGDPAWLSRAASAGDFIRSHFSRGQGGGFASSDTTRPSFPLPRPEFDENTAVVRFTVALSAATGRADFRDMAATAMRWLLAGGGPESHGFYVAGLLLAEEEARTDALHIAIVGDDDDSASIALFTTALHVATAHRLIERWDRAKGPAPRGEDIYPDLPKAAAFVCGHGTCSAPIYAASALKSRLDALEGMPP